MYWHEAEPEPEKYGLRELVETAGAVLWFFFVGLPLLFLDIAWCRLRGYWPPYL